MDETGYEALLRKRMGFFFKMGNSVHDIFGPYDNLIAVNVFKLFFKHRFDIFYLTREA